MPLTKKKKVIDIFPRQIKVSEISEELSWNEKSKKRAKAKAVLERGEVEIKPGIEPEKFAPILEKKELLERKTKEEFSEKIRERIRMPSFPINNRMIAKFIFLGILGFGLYYFSFVFLAKAEIRIVPKKVELSLVNARVVIDRNVSAANYDQGILPGNLLFFREKEEKNYQSTGLGKDEIKAKGTIVIYNNFSTAPQILVAITRFEAPDGKVFRLDSRIIIPGATTQNGKLVPATVEAEVTADKPGPEYNIGPCNENCKFTIPGFKGTPKYEGFYGLSNKPMTGGSLGAVPMVAPEDIKEAESDIIDSLMKKIDESLKNKVKKIQEGLKNKIPSELIVLEKAKSTPLLTSLKSDVDIGDFRQNFTVSAEGELKIIVFKQENLIDFIKHSLRDEKDEKYDFCGNSEMEYKEIKPDFENGILKLLFNAEQATCYSFSEKDIKLLVIGKKVAELGTIFKEAEGVEEIKIRAFPFWVKRIPFNTNKIKVIFDPRID